MGVETLLHVPAPRREAFTLSLFCSLAPGWPQPHRVPGGPQLPHTPSNGGATPACPRPCSAARRARPPACPSLSPSPKQSPRLCGPEASLLLPCPACPASRVLPSPTGLPSTPGPSPQPLGAVSSPHPPHVDPTWHLSVPARCQNFDRLRAFACAVSSSETSAHPTLTQPAPDYGRLPSHSAEQASQKHSFPDRLT